MMTARRQRYIVAVC